MPGLRSPTKFDRNIHFVNGVNDEIAGTWQNGSLTWAEMSEWMQIVFLYPLEGYAPFPCLESGDPNNPVAQHGAPINVLGNSNIIQPGFYILLSHQGSLIDIPVNAEMPIPRVLSRSLSNTDPRNYSFRLRVRTRDYRCVITGEKPICGEFFGLQAAHIFPVAHLDLWKEGHWQQQIDDDQYIRSTAIHSVQNGILLRSDIYELFDKFIVTINPDNDYKTHCFLDKPYLDKITMFRNPDILEKFQPSRAVLKHHFRMSVLLNMKGRAGYPEWDEDITPGLDSIFEISNSEQGKFRFETVLSEKLNSLVA